MNDEREDELEDGEEIIDNFMLPLIEAVTTLYIEGTT